MLSSSCFEVVQSYAVALRACLMAMPTTLTRPQHMPHAHIKLHAYTWRIHVHTYTSRIEMQVVQLMRPRRRVISLRLADGGMLSCCRALITSSKVHVWQLAIEVTHVVSDL